MSYLPLSSSNPYEDKARTLTCGEALDKYAVEHFVLNGQLNITEEIDPSTGAGTGKYYVRLLTEP